MTYVVRVLHSRVIRKMRYLDYIHTRDAFIIEGRHAFCDAPHASNEASRRSAVCDTCTHLLRDLSQRVCEIAAELRTRNSDFCLCRKTRIIRSLRISSLHDTVRYGICTKLFSIIHSENNFPQIIFLSN